MITEQELKDIVEEAEEMYNKYKLGTRLCENKDYQVTYKILIDKLYEAIQELKKNWRRIDNGRDNNNVYMSNRCCICVLERAQE